MSKSQAGNTVLKSARQYAGFGTQQKLADALTRAAPTLGLGEMEVSVRQIRRWESPSPPWPREEHQRLLVHVLKRPVEELGFVPPWAEAPNPAGSSTSVGPSLVRIPLPRAGAATQPSTIGAEYATVTAAHRRMYWTVQPAELHPAVTAHAQLGLHLLGETEGVTRKVLAIALAESLLLAGRIAFFDLRQPADAEATYFQALHAAGEAEDALLGAAVLAHAAFVPGWAQRRKEAAERLRAARAYARRGPASSSFMAWIDAVEAECETVSGRLNEALHAIARAEETIADGSDHQSPDWFTWFSPARLAAFKGNTLLVTERYAQARDALTVALEALTTEEGKQRTVVLADLAAVDAALEQPGPACEHIHEALDQLASTWYATGMERIRGVRDTLQPWAETEDVRRVDDRLYSWQTTLSALQS